MKKLISIVLPLLLAALILTAGALLPQAAIRRQRQDYLNQKLSVPVEAVQPYGEEYEERKNKLLSSIRTLREMENTDYYEVLSMEYADDKTAERYQAGVERLWGFFGLVLDDVPWISIFDSEDGMERQENLIYPPKDLNSGLGQIIGINKEYGFSNMVCFDLETGLPFALELACVAEETETDPIELWEGVLAAYEKASGIPFNTQATTEDGNANSAVQDSLYQQIHMEAVSSDGVFRLGGQYYQNQNEIFIVLSLEENDEN